MRIVWVMRSFLDYRIILYQKLSEMPGVEFTLLTSRDIVPESVRAKTIAALGDKVQFLSGEKCFGTPYSPEQRSNEVRRICWQPGLAKKIMELHPDIVITDAFNNWTLPVLWLRSHHHFKHIVCYERTAYTERNAPWLKRKFIHFVGHWVDAVHYNGILCHDFLRELGYPEYKLKPGNMTVDVTELAASANEIDEKKRCELREKWGILPDDIAFLFVGNLIPRKGVSEFLIGWKQWLLENPNAKVKLLIVGEGKEDVRIRTFCKENSLDNVILAGKSSYEDIPKFFALSDVFVIPTLEDNWSLVVPEAMACGKPIMCSCYNGCYPELVKDNGWIFDPLNSGDIVKKLAEVYASKDRFPVMGEISRKLVSLYGPDEIAAGIYRTCKETCRKEKANKVPESVSHNIVEAVLVPGRYRAVYSDKNMFDKFMPQGILPKTYLRRMQGVFRDEDYSVIKNENINLSERLGSCSRCIVKPTVDSSSGHGVTVFEKKDGCFYAINGELSGEKMTLNTLQRYFGKDFLVQEYLEQCDFMKKLCSTSINTIRLFVYRSVKTEEVVVPAVIMRLGHEGSLVDNSHACGVSIGIDRNGVLGKYTTNQYGQKITVVNGIDFEHTQWQIPHFDRVLNLAKTVGAHLLHSRMANIDVMLDKQEMPRLVEYNLSGMGTWVYQFDIGLAYGQYTDEIIEYCEKNKNVAQHVHIEY